MQLHHGEAPAEAEPERGLPSWDKIVQSAYQRAYTWLRSGYARGWQPADWEDMAQEAVCRVLKEIATGKVERQRFAVEGWFRTVVRNVAIDRQRKHAGRRGGREFLPEDKIETLTDERTEAQLNHVLAKLDVQALLEDPTVLQEHERVVLELRFGLRYGYELSSREIAEVLGMDSDSTVRTWLKNALRKLQEHYGEAQET